MKYSIIAVVAIFMLAMGLYFSQKENKDMAVKTISPQEAKEKIDADEVILVDVRAPEEYATGHLIGAVLLPDYELKEKAETVFPEKDKTLLVYCRSGHRSKAAARVLSQMGYTAVYDMGGILDWPYDIEK